MRPLIKRIGEIGIVGQALFTWYYIPHEMLTGWAGNIVFSLPRQDAYRRFAGMGITVSKVLRGMKPGQHKTFFEKSWMGGYFINPWSSRFAWHIKFWRWWYVGLPISGDVDSHLAELNRR